MKYLERKEFEAVHWVVANMASAFGLIILSGINHVFRFNNFRFAGGFAGTRNDKIVRVCPPVMFVLLWNYLSQHFRIGSLASAMEFMPGNGTSEVIERTPTWLARFNSATAYGIRGRAFLPPKRKALPLFR